MCKKYVKLISKGLIIHYQHTYLSVHDFLNFCVCFLMTDEVFVMIELVCHFLKEAEVIRVAWP